MKWPFPEVWHAKIPQTVNIPIPLPTGQNLDTRGIREKKYHLYNANCAQFVPKGRPIHSQRVAAAPF